MSDEDKAEIFTLFLVALVIGFIYCVAAMALVMWLRRDEDGGDDWKRRPAAPEPRPGPRADLPTPPRQTVPVPELKPEMVQ
jgi:hypothetical protein